MVKLEVDRTTNSVELRYSQGKAMLSRDKAKPTQAEEQEKDGRADSQQDQDEEGPRKKRD